MLRSLDIRDVLIIDQMHIELGSGLNVLTGETGAGKSILLDALGFVLGHRGRADIVRSGAKQGEVTAIFDLPQAHNDIFDELGINSDDGELILRRVITADGRKTAWINNSRVSAEALRKLSGHLLEIHGQHDDKGLLDPRSHRFVLDAFAKIDLNPLRDAWRVLRICRDDLSKAEQEYEKAKNEEDFLRHSVKELDLLNPRAGEDALLDIRRRNMKKSETIRGDIERSFQIVGEDGAEGALRDAMHSLEKVAGHSDGHLDVALDFLGRAQVELSEALTKIEDYLRSLDIDHHELENVEERLFAIRALARKHSVLPDELGPYADSLRARLQALELGEGELLVRRKNLAEAEDAYQSKALLVRDMRLKAATLLDEAVIKELAPLKMDRAIFKTEISDAPSGPDGMDSVSFTIAANPGAPAGALNHVASGGELSRLLLALKVCLHPEIEGITMIFDEIDRGVGGATADAVGRRLKSLSREAQILVVTHSPQVAALGTHHWRVEKLIRAEQTLSQVVGLSFDERVEEIARMLSADTVTDEARAAARTLLDG